MSKLKILYRDDHLVAIFKPAGMLIHPSPYARDVKEYVVDRLSAQLKAPVYPVHRLDRPTSGVMVFALHSRAANRMSRAFAKKRVHKTYLAIVRGYPPEVGRIRIPLTKEALHKRADAPRMSALTCFRRLATIELPQAVGRYNTARYALVRAHPITGRGHQIRRHLRHLNHPVIGDKRRGDTQHNRFFESHLKAPGLMLAAVQITFVHPYLGVRMTLGHDVVGNLKSALQQLGWGPSLRFL